MNNLSDQIFEAIVVGIDYERGVCSLSLLDANSDSTIHDVPLPHIAGNGNAGIFFGLNLGTRVLATFTSSKSRNITVIAALIPKPNLYSEVFKQGIPSDLPNGVYAYPSISDGEVMLRGDRSAEIYLKNSGDVLLRTVNGGGVYLKRNQTRSSFLLAAEDIVNYSNGSKLINGAVRRMTSTQRGLFPRPDLTQTPLFADPEYANRTVPYGFFTGSNPLRRSYQNRKRNPEISEYRLVINEFSTDYMFTGFDDEVNRASNSTSMYDNSETYVRNREQGSTLHLAEHELIEIIGGNVVDINGNVLDINYHTLVYGKEGNKVPSPDAVSYDRAKRVSRRGIGYHFQLTTNTVATDPSQSKSNFLFDIDKEGLLKVNIPASSNTGNVPFTSNADFLGDGDTVNVSFLNPSAEELIPVTLRADGGSVVYPKETSQSVRDTGIRYNDGEVSPYFATGNTEVRVNPTKYHNMYAVAERLIANTIRIVNLPQRFTNDAGFPEGLSILKAFEVPLPSSLNEDESLTTTLFRDLFPAGSSDFPTYMSVVGVEPGEPAIDPGGTNKGTLIVAGKDRSSGSAYSNSFEDVLADTGEQKPVGGKSANINLEGSLELSVGQDNNDNKSIVLDTAGAIIAWLGKDKNNRSMIMQTDGDFLLNVGGTYEGGTVDNPPTMLPARFELRVNVTDKGFVNVSGNPGPESDYIISISENGLVIAGMKYEMPMIIRNDGPILIESTSSDVTLKGIQVKTVGPKGAMNVIKPPTRGTDTRDPLADV